MRAVALALCLAVLGGCSSSSPPPARTAKDAQRTEPKPTSPPSAEAAPTPPVAAATQAPAPAPEDASLPPTLEGPDIPRAQLLLVLKAGVGRYLQKVRTEAQFDRGRFVGWRVVELFPFGAPDGSTGVVRPGDTLQRVNGQSIERPEQLMTIWESLATESQLVLNIVRAGKASEVRHRIVQ